MEHISYRALSYGCLLDNTNYQTFVAVWCHVMPQPLIEFKMYGDSGDHYACVKLENISGFHW